MNSPKSNDESWRKSLATAGAILVAGICFAFWREAQQPWLRGLLATIAVLVLLQAALQVLRKRN